MKKMPIIILCGIAAVLVTIILYFTILGNIFAELICFVTLVGVVLAEIIVTFIAYHSNGNPGKIAATILSAIMIPVSIVLSSVYIINFPHGYGSYLGYYFSILVALLIIIAIIWKFSDGIQEKNLAFHNAKENMLNMRKLVKAIMTESGAEKYNKELSNIEEQLHFSNDSVIIESDSEICAMLRELRNNINSEDFDANASIKLIAQKIELRNISAKKTV